MTAELSHEDIIRRTRSWLEKAVIGLNLCPFAHAVHARNRIRYVVSSAETDDDLREDLLKELLHLKETDPEETETTLLIHPWVLDDFLDFNDFLDEADNAIMDLDLTGILQVASFHPRYQFADSTPDAIENYSNRSPYPMLHLLRESSIDRAIESHPDVDGIPDKNMDTLSRLGLKGWKALGIEDEGDA
jgi:hypothetical protein